MSAPRPLSFPRFLRVLRFVVRDLCWMVTYVSLAAAVAGVARAVWLIIEATVRRQP